MYIHKFHHLLLLLAIYTSCPTRLRTGDVHFIRGVPNKKKKRRDIIFRLEIKLQFKYKNLDHTQVLYCNAL